MIKVGDRVVCVRDFAEFWPKNEANIPIISQIFVVKDITAGSFVFDEYPNLVFSRFNRNGPFFILESEYDENK